MHTFYCVECNICRHDTGIGGIDMRFIAILLISVILSGCGNVNAEMDRALSIRSRLENSGCEFLATITADYFDYIHTFSMFCHIDKSGSVDFSVVSPESIAGVTGQVSASGGKLTFDNHTLLFSLLSESLLSPVSAPWAFIYALRGGYISGIGKYSGGIKIEINETYEDNALKLLVWVNSENTPVNVEMFDQGVRIILFSCNKNTS